MKNITTKIILSVIVFLSVIGFVSTASAAGASLYVSPASLTKTAGDTFSVSVGFNASGSKVCAVEGTLVFNNLFCQSITVASDVMAQSSPTCLNPYFLIGIPNCTTSDKTLLTASVISGKAGTASIGLTGVDIIGEGISILSESSGGTYNIIAVPVTPKITEETVGQKEETTGEAAEQVVTQKQEEITPENPFLARLDAVFQKIASIWLLVAIIIIGLGYGVFYFFNNFKIIRK